jgi:hypothetical protein
VVWPQLGVADRLAAGNSAAGMVQGDYMAVDNSHVAGHNRSLAEEAGPEAPRYNSWQLVHSYLRMKLREGERAKRRKEKETKRGKQGHRI